MELCSLKFLRIVAHKLIMNTGNTDQVTEAWRLAEKGLRTRVPATEVNTILQESTAALLLLRWIDEFETNCEVRARLDGNTFHPVFPHHLRWNNWAAVDSEEVLLGRLVDIIKCLTDKSCYQRRDRYPWARSLARPLIRIARKNYKFLKDYIHSIASLPFSSLEDKGSVLKAFDEFFYRQPRSGSFQFSPSTDAASLLAAIAEPQAGEDVYDPCFGHAALLISTSQQAKRANFENSHEVYLNHSGLEREVGTFVVGMARLMLAGLLGTDFAAADSLDVNVNTIDPNKKFDLVVANPPVGIYSYSTVSSSEMFAIPVKSNAGAFIQHALSKLKKGGRAAVVVPDGFLVSNDEDKKLRQFLVEEGYLSAVVGVPAGVFSPDLKVKQSILLLKNDAKKVKIRMADASVLFDQKASMTTSSFDTAAAQEMANYITGSASLSQIIQGDGKSHSSGRSSVMSSLFWELEFDELKATGWNLSPRVSGREGSGEVVEVLKKLLSKSGGSISPLGDIAEVISGASLDLSALTDFKASENSIGIIRIKDLSGWKVDRPSTWLGPSTMDSIRSSVLRDGDLVLSRAGSIGRVSVVRGDAVGCVASEGVYILRLRTGQCVPEFLQAYLSSSVCQNWFSLKARGAVVKHLGRESLENLSCPILPINLQRGLAGKFQNSGGDVVSTLRQVAEKERFSGLRSWIVQLSNAVPKQEDGDELFLSLAPLEKAATLAQSATKWTNHEGANRAVAPWFVDLVNSLRSLTGVSKIPPGPGLLSVLQDAERCLRVVLDGSQEPQSRGDIIYVTVSRLLDYLSGYIARLAGSFSLGVSSIPETLNAGSLHEFTVLIKNQGALPVRNLRMKTVPDWGHAEVGYLPEGGEFRLSLRGRAPADGQLLELRLKSRAQALDGSHIDSDIEVPIRIAAGDVDDQETTKDLGGSPYVTGSPLEPKHGHKVFFGREGLLKRISRQIRDNGNVVLLEGNRRAGKTSILKHLEGVNVIPKWISVYASLQGAEGDSKVLGIPTAEVFREVARSIAAGLIKNKMECPLPNGKLVPAGSSALGIARACREGISEDSPFIDFREYLETVLSQLEEDGFGLVLMLDEFDKLQEGIDSGITSAQVPENIRFLIQTYSSFSAILTGSRRLKRLREEYWSALYGLGTRVQVTALDIESARNVVTQPVEGKLVFSSDSVERIVYLTACQPYLVQCLCNRIFEYAADNKISSITLNEVGAAASALVSDNEHFASLWDYAGQGPATGKSRRQFILFRCASALADQSLISFGSMYEEMVQSGIEINEAALDDDLLYLRELELVTFVGEAAGGHYQLSIPMMADWIEQRHDGNVIVSRARNEAG
ncbi:N-6 DNA methylase [Microbulbifer marinus]|uniref:site-specific DNA-methyltransferase (adenine-specific) n=1 Tax=Microbulbifer marinus TaxID=658218 RepID=A0A1H3WHG9_9GAMM|nr:N-6 DNA methylase [Microbulbifer marinus]SDZ85782.1 type I restriction enzyme M protein [Microbulbifer marinus]